PANSAACLSLISPFSVTNYWPPSPRCPALLSPQRRIRNIPYVIDTTRHGARLCHGRCLLHPSMQRYAQCSCGFAVRSSVSMAPVGSSSPSPSVVDGPPPPALESPSER